MFGGFTSYLKLIVIDLRGMKQIRDAVHNSPTDDEIEDDLISFQFHTRANISDEFHIHLVKPKHL